MRYFSALAAASVSLIALAPAAIAQDQDGAPQASDDEGDDAAIIVTARRRDERIQDVPAVVNAVTADTIEQLNLRKLQDIESVVPGLSLVPNANGIGSVSTLRGVDFNVNVSGNNGTIDFYLNDAPLSSGPVFQSMFDVGQIEVLRGPQGTLKGRASPSGAISIGLRKPNLQEVGGNLTATLNNIGGYNLNGAMNIPVIRDKLAVRIAGIVGDDDGNEVRPLNNAEKIYNRSKGIRASVRSDPFDGALVFDFLYQGFNRESRGYDQVESFNQVVTGGAASPVTIKARDRVNVDGFPRTGNQTFKIYNWSIKGSQFGQTLTYVGQRLGQRLESFTPSDVAGIFASDTVRGIRFGQPTNTRSRNLSHEIRLQNEDRVAGIFDYVVGYLRYKTSSTTNLLSPTGIAIGPPFANPPRLVNIALTPIFRTGGNLERSVFGNVTAHIGDKFEISGGLRKIRYNNQASLAIGGFVNPAFNQDERLGKTIYSGSVKFRLNDDLMVYANTGTSWRPGAIAITTSLSGAIRPQQRAFLVTDSESSKSYEAGFKADLLDKKLRVNLAVYQQKFQDYPYRAPSGVFTINPGNNTVQSVSFINGVPVKVTGVELEMAANPTDNFNIGAVVGYAKGNISNGIIPCTDLNGDGVPDVITAAPTLAQLEAAVGTVADPTSPLVDSCASNARSNNAPRLTASVNSEYRMAVGDKMDGFVRGLYSFKGKSLTDPVNPFDNLDAFGILNLYLGLRDSDGGWELSLFGKNITNTFRVLSRSNGPIVTPLRGGIPLFGPVRSMGSSSATNYFGELRTTEPREFGISLRVAFGSR